jgi:RNA polymerase sigma-70 factor, ECF subfamily
MAAPPPDLTDLLTRVALRDQTAYEVLYRASAPKLFGFALRILRTRELAEDCLQDAFVSIWHRAGDYRPDRAQPFTWMAAIVRNRAFDMLRAGQGKAVGADDVEAWDVETSDDSDAAGAAREARALLRCLDDLPPRQRQAIALSYFRGFAHGEVAARLREPLGTVKTWIRKGLMQLKHCLEHV